MDQNDFLKEADVMKTMDHTNVIQLLGVRSKPFQIIMEYASHGSILHYMKSKTWVQIMHTFAG